MTLIPTKVKVVICSESILPAAVCVYPGCDMSDTVREPSHSNAGVIDVAVGPAVPGGGWGSDRPGSGRGEGRSQRSAGSPPIPPGVSGTRRLSPAMPAGYLETRTVPRSRRLGARSPTALPGVLLGAEWPPYRLL